jgi:hypothetical protein
MMVKDKRRKMRRYIWEIKEVKARNTIAKK